MSSEFATRVRALNAIRLSHDWTWAQLSADMGRFHVQVPPRTLHHMVKHPDIEPHDRTRFKVETYIDGMKEQARRQRVRKVNAAAKKSAVIGRGV